MKAILRVASFALPSVVIILALLVCWRRHFVEHIILWAGLTIAGSFYFAIFLNRRSRGFSARIFETQAGPDRDFSHNDQADMGALTGAAIFVGFLAYILIKHW
jgi:hypothetical protein